MTNAVEFLRLLVLRMFLSPLTLCNSSVLTRWVQLIALVPTPAAYFDTLKVFLLYFTQSFGAIATLRMQHCTSFFLK